MANRHLLIPLFLVVIIAFGAAVKTQTAQAQGHLTAAQIKAGLRVIPEIDQGFVDSVVAKTHSGDLPRRILHAAYYYAIKKEEHRFQHFERAIRIFASREGIRL
jgi:hypothetical protein